MVSLFTSVPIDECADEIEKIIDSMEEIPLQGNHIKRLLALCTTDVQFQFNGTLYTQTDGVAMGSPLGPILADIYMGLVEQKLQETIGEWCVWYGRYVDDILIIIHRQADAPELLTKFNEVHEHIDFVMEMEKEGSLPFLDVNIFREDTTLEFGWFHKPTWSGQFTHYNSFVPVQWKIGLLKGFKHKLLTLCSPSKLNSAVGQLEQAFRNNGYPDDFIEEHFSSFVPAKKPSVQGPSMLVAYIELPFMGDTASMATKARINRMVQSHFSAAKVVVRDKVNKAAHFSAKDKVPIEQASGVVYQFTCDCGETYIGRTEKTLQQRAKQHFPKWLKNGEKQRPRSQAEPKSSVTRHVMRCAEFTDPPKFKLLHKQHGKQLNRILEAIHIKIDKPSLCVQKELLYDLQLNWS